MLGLLLQSLDAIHQTLMTGFEKQNNSRAGYSPYTACNTGSLSGTLVLKIKILVRYDADLVLGSCQTPQLELLPQKNRDTQNKPRGQISVEDDTRLLKETF